MNAKVISAVLVVVSLGLAGALFVVSSRARKERQAATAASDQLKGELIRSETRLGEAMKEKATLETNLVRRIAEVGLFSNKLDFIQAELSKTEQEAKAAALAAQKEIEEREKAISGLKAEKDELTARMGELTRRLESVVGEIRETERKLATSEGDREVLKKELRRLMAEKADLEKRYNDLATLQEQMRKLREEAYVARRMEIIRKGVINFDQKGAQLLKEGVRRAVSTNQGGANPELEVEFRTDAPAQQKKP